MSGTARTRPEGRRRAEIGTYIHFYKKYDNRFYKIFSLKNVSSGTKTAPGGLRTPGRVRQKMTKTRKIYNFYIIL